MPTTAQRVHFEPELFEFLRQLGRNNRRDWFEKNKQRYLDHVREPMLRFIEDLGPRLRKLSPRIVADPSPVGGSMFRIHRDVRFSKDKSPYKTWAAARFPVEGGKNVHTPGFYLGMGPGEIHVGAGIWRPEPRALERIRAAIVEEPAAWKRVQGSLGAKHPFRGDTLSRPPRGYAADHPLIEDLKRKDFVTMVDLDEKTACRSDFIDRYVALCRGASPLVKWLCGVLGLRW